MDKTMMILVVFVLGMSFQSCSGFPVYDYDPSSLKAALDATVAKVNSQALSPYLFRAFRSSVKRVSVMDEDNSRMDIEFGIRETVCRRDSGDDPSTCAFQRGYYVPTAICRSSVQVSAQQMIFEDMLRTYRWRNNYRQDLIPDEPRNEEFQDRTPETMRSFFPPGDRRFPARQYRQRTYTGFE